MLDSMTHQPLRLALSAYTISTSGKTPPFRNPYINPCLFRQAPQSCLQARKAVALDCEMVHGFGGQLCAYLSAIDFITGELLLNCHVQPSENVTDWCSRYSGITKTSMDQAVFSATALRDWQDARESLFSFVDQNTILVGHALNNDLDVLGITHSKIIDTSIVIAEKVFMRNPTSTMKKFPRQFGLKMLVEELMGFRIQKGSMGHMAREDAQATRDLLLWCIQWPTILDAWALKAFQAFETKSKEWERKLMDAKAKQDREMKNKKQQTWRQRQFLERDDLQQKHSIQLQDLLRIQTFEQDQSAKVHSQQLLALQAKQSNQWGKLCARLPPS